MSRDEYRINPEIKKLLSEPPLNISQETYERFRSLLDLAVTGEASFAELKPQFLSVIQHSEQMEEPA